MFLLYLIIAPIVAGLVYKLFTDSSSRFFEKDHEYIGLAMIFAGLVYKLFTDSSSRFFEKDHEYIGLAMIFFGVLWPVVIPCALLLYSGCFIYDAVKWCVGKMSNLRSKNKA